MAGGDNYCLNSLIININYGVFTKYSRTRTRTKLAGFYEQKSFCNCNDGRFCRSIDFLQLKEILSYSCLWEKLNFLFGYSVLVLNTLIIRSYKEAHFH